MTAPNNPASFRPTPEPHRPPYFSDASDRPINRSDLPSRSLPGSISVLARSTSGPHIGVAFASGSIGGRDWSKDPRGDRPEPAPAEITWRLVLGGAEIDGRWALRGGRFVELAEGAE